MPIMTSLIPRLISTESRFAGAREKGCSPMKRTLVGVFAATVIGMHLLGGAAQAQYPQTLGSIICDTGGITIVTTNTGVGLTATLTNAAGQPVSGQTINLVAQGPNGAIISQGTVTTNSNGAATLNLNVGNTPGNITLSATGGTLSCSANVTSRPPVSEVLGSTFVAPATGDAGLVAQSGGSNTNTLMLMASGIVAALAAGLVGFRRIHN